MLISNTHITDNSSPARILSLQQVAALNWCWCCHVVFCSDDVLKCFCKIKIKIFPKSCSPSFSWYQHVHMCLFFTGTRCHWWVLTSTFTRDSVHEHGKVKNQTPPWKWQVCYVSGMTQSATVQASVFRFVLCCVFLDYVVL